MRDRVSVLAAVIQRDGHFLIGRRPAGKRHGGLWEFPGGKLHDGESWLSGMSRELREELGVDVIEIGEPWISLPDPGSRFLIHFIPTEIGGEPASTEHEQMQWVALNELVDFDLAPTDREFAEYLLRHEGGE